jgi:hypothetical protein
VLACLLGAALLSLLLFADWLVDRWLRLRASGEAATGRVLLACAAPTMLAAGATGAAFFAIGLWRLPLRTAALDRFELAAAAFAGLFSLGVVVTLATHWPKRKKLPHADLLGRIGETTLRQQVAEAVEFQRVLGARILPSLASLLLGTALTMAGVLLVCAAVGALGTFFGGMPKDPLNVEGWPVLLKLAAGVALAAFMLLGATAKLGAFRLVKAIGESGRVRPGIVALEAGKAFEHAGFFGTLGWGLLNLFCALLVLLTSFALAGLLAGASFPAPGPWWLALPIAAVLLVVLVLWPQMYTLAILASRDCGWLLASEVGTTLIEIEGITSLRKLLRVLLWSLTIWKLPAAIHLLLATAKHYDLIISRMLNEKSQREIEEVLRGGEAERPANLARAWKALEAGRYLDALNAFQIHQHNNRADVDSLKGEAMALLFMGNPNARERLERWERLAPDDPEATRLVAELNAGLWSANGAKLAEAMKRCTQTIGRGV